MKGLWISTVLSLCGPSTRSRAVYARDKKSTRYAGGFDLLTETLFIKKSLSLLWGRLEKLTRSIKVQRLYLLCSSCPSKRMLKNTLFNLAYLYYLD